MGVIGVFEFVFSPVVGDVVLSHVVNKLVTEQFNSIDSVLELYYSRALSDQGRPSRFVVSVHSTEVVLNTFIEWLEIGVGVGSRLGLKVDFHLYRFVDKVWVAICSSNRHCVVVVC